MEVLELDPCTHVPSPLHGADRDWRESNCYVDVWLELLHALRLDARACLGFTLAVDFEEDQWTFHKPGLDDLYELYGLHIEELNLWKGLISHCETQTALGRIPLLEVDAFFLPDTALSNYHMSHGKTTIAINLIEPESRRLGYFHNCGYYELCGDDFVGLFRLDDPMDDRLAPYCETVKLERLVRRPEPQLRAAASELLRKYVGRAPERNPFHAFAGSLEAAVNWLVEEPEHVYHAYMFASLRQCGSAYELAARHMQWLEPDFRATEAAESFLNISETAKRLVMKIARMVQRGQAREVSTEVAVMGESWERAFHTLRSRST